MNLNGNDSTELDIKTTSIKTGLNVFSAVNSRLRQQMLSFIHKKGQVTVTELFTEEHTKGGFGPVEFRSCIQVTKIMCCTCRYAKRS